MGKVPFTLERMWTTKIQVQLNCDHGGLVDDLDERVYD